MDVVFETMTNEQAIDLNFTSARAVHAIMPPHEPDCYTSTSAPFAIGVSFTGHREAVIEDGSGRSAERSFPPGTCGINGRIHHLAPGKRTF